MIRKARKTEQAKIDEVIKYKLEAWRFVGKKNERRINDPFANTGCPIVINVAKFFWIASWNTSWMLSMHVALFHRKSFFIEMAIYVISKSLSFFKT